MTPLLKRPEPTAEDNSILDAARNLSSQLDLHDLSFTRVSWWEYRGKSQPMPSDQPDFTGRTILLQKEMSGKLAANEWKPLLASSLIFTKKLKPALRPRLILNLIAPFIGVAVVEIVALLLYPSQAVEYSPLALVFGIAGVSLVLVGMRRYYPKLRKARLQADNEAAIIVGREAFLNVLKKIDALGMKDVEMWKNTRRGRGFSDRPNITERIANLQYGA